MEQGEVLVIDDTDNGTKIDTRVVEPIVIDGKECIRVTTKYNAASWFLNKKNKIIVAIFIVIAVIATICTLGIILGFSGIIIRSITTRVQIKSAVQRVEASKSIFGGRRLKMFSLKTLVDIYWDLRHTKEGNKHETYFGALERFSKFMQRGLLKELARYVININPDAEREKAIENIKGKEGIDGFVKGVKETEVASWNAFLYFRIMVDLAEYFTDVIYPGIEGLEFKPDESWKSLVVDILKITGQLWRYIRYFHIYKDAMGGGFRAHDLSFYDIPGRLGRISESVGLSSKKIAIDAADFSDISDIKEDVKGKKFMLMLADVIITEVSKFMIIPATLTTLRMAQFLGELGKKVWTDFKEHLKGFGVVSLFVAASPWAAIAGIILKDDDLKKSPGMAVIAFFAPVWYILLFPFVSTIAVIVKRFQARSKLYGFWERLRDAVFDYEIKDVIKTFFLMFRTPFALFYGFPKFMVSKKSSVDGIIHEIEDKINDVRSGKIVKSKTKITFNFGVSKIIKKLDADFYYEKIPGNSNDVKVDVGTAPLADEKDYKLLVEDAPLADEDDELSKGDAPLEPVGKTQASSNEWLTKMLEEEKPNKSDKAAEETDEIIRKLTKQ